MILFRHGILRNTHAYTLAHTSSIYSWKHCLVFTSSKFRLLRLDGRYSHILASDCQVTETAWLCIFCKAGCRVLINLPALHVINTEHFLCLPSTLCIHCNAHADVSFWGLSCNNWSLVIHGTQQEAILRVWLHDHTHIDGYILRVRVGFAGTPNMLGHCIQYLGMNTRLLLHTHCWRWVW